MCNAPKGFVGADVRKALGIPCRYSILLVVATGYAQQIQTSSDISLPHNIITIRIIILVIITVIRIIIRIIMIIIMNKLIPVKQNTCKHLNVLLVLTDRGILAQSP